MTGNDVEVTDSYRELRRQIGEQFGVTTAVLDGVVVALDKASRPSCS